MSMREYEEAKNIVIPKEQEEMMDIICDAWEECRSLESCKDCQDRPLSTMSMMMCTALKYTRKLVEAGYTNLQAADVGCCGRLRGVTYEDGKVTAVYIRDTDDAVKVFTKVRHGRWIEPKRLYYGAKQYECSICYSDTFWKKHSITEKYPHCPNCGVRMDGGDD